VDTPVEGVSFLTVSIGQILLVWQLWYRHLSFCLFHRTRLKIAFFKLQTCSRVANKPLFSAKVDLPDVLGMGEEEQAEYFCWGISEFQAGWAGFLGHQGGVWLLPAVTPVCHMQSSRLLLKEQQEHQSSPDRFTISVVIGPYNSVWVEYKSLVCSSLTSLVSATILPRTLSDSLVSFFQPTYICSVFGSTSESSSPPWMLHCPIPACLPAAHSGIHPPARHTLPHHPVIIPPAYSKTVFIPVFDHFPVWIFKLTIISSSSYACLIDSSAVWLLTIHLAPEPTCSCYPNFCWSQRINYFVPKWISLLSPFPVLSEAPVTVVNVLYLYSPLQQYISVYQSALQQIINKRISKKQ